MRTPDGTTYANSSWYTLRIATPNKALKARKAEITSHSFENVIDLVPKLALKIAPSPVRTDSLNYLMIQDRRQYVLLRGLPQKPT